MWISGFVHGLQGLSGRHGLMSTITSLTDLHGTTGGVGQQNQFICQLNCQSGPDVATNGSNVCPILSLVCSAGSVQQTRQSQDRWLWLFLACMVCHWSVIKL